jgi:hypothetical protein
MAESDTENGRECTNPIDLFGFSCHDNGSFMRISLM